MYSLLNLPLGSSEKYRVSFRFRPFNLLTSCAARSQRLARLSRPFGRSSFTLPRYVGNSWCILFWVVSIPLLFVVYCLFTVIHSRSCHCVWATANIIFFLLLFHTLISSISFQFFSILPLCTSSTLICIQILYSQSLLVGNTLYSLVPNNLLCALRILFASFRWLPPLDLPTVLSALQSQFVLFHRTISRYPVSG